jgi:ABC-type antimicrobial peptide transport system permease subunit
MGEQHEIYTACKSFPEGRRAVGATRGDILLQFLIEALFTTFTGGIIGVLAGFGVSKSLLLFAHFPVVVSWIPFVVGSIF